MIRHRRLLTLTLLALTLAPATARAEFTTAEKASIYRSRVAGEKARQSLDDLAGAVEVGTTAESRAALADAMWKTFLIVRPLNLMHIYLLHGSIGSSGFELSSQSCRDIPNDGSSNVPQTVYVACAWEAADLAAGAYSAAQTALAAAQAFNPSNTTYQNELASAISLLGTSELRLSQVDRTLAYTDPSPALGDVSQGAPTVSGLIGGTGIDAGRIVGPHGPYTYTVLEGSRAVGEYGNSALGELIELYSLDSLLPEYASYVRAVQKVLRAQDRVQRSLGRFARVQGGEAGESADPTWRVRLLRASRDLTDVPGNDFHEALGYPEEFPLVEHAATRPAFRVKLRAAFRDITGSWRRADGTAWRMNFVPGAGIAP